MKLAAFSTVASSPPSSAAGSKLSKAKAIETSPDERASVFDRMRAIPRFRRRRIIVIVLVLVLLAELFFLTYVAMANGKENNRAETGQAAVNPNPKDLIAGQLSNNHGKVIADIGYDSALTMNTYESRIASADVSALRPLSNNYLTKTGTGDNEKVVLIDETAVGRIISFNSDWVIYSEGTNNEVFSDIAKGSGAEGFLNAYKGYKIAMHRLALGAIYTDGSKVYVLAQLTYTVLKDGKAASVNDVFLYTLVKQQDTLVISDIEQILLPAAQETAGGQ